MKPDLDIQTVASQGNAVLGIRGSGKTYTATWLAEQFLEASIPFVAFDPIGVWRFLKVPGAGKAFKVVVAGGEHGDLPLTPQSAPEIVRAAMHENIPLVLDLYSMELSKADWKKIVESAIRLLLYENKKCGLRHVFIEEAAEFVPQRISPDQGRVYAEVEKLARMGGNASLGYTLVNQRAEEVNKAVLELCDCLFLHRQKGRNSLNAVEKWLAYADEDRAEKITKSLPSLEAGHCWIWSEGSNEPQLVKIPVKRSFHPDRKNPLVATAEKSALDVKDFVHQLRSSLQTKIEEDKSNDVEPLKARIRELEKVVATPKEKIVEVPILTGDQEAKLLATIEKLGLELKAVRQAIIGSKRPTVARPVHPVVTRQPAKRVDVERASDSGRIEGGLRRMLIALAQRPQGMSAKQVAVRAGLSSSSGTFGTYLGRARSNGWIDGEREHLRITEEGLHSLGSYDRLPEGKALLYHWLATLQGGAGRMLSVLAEAYPSTLTAEEVGELSSISSNSGTFGTYLGKLRTLELVEGSRQALKASEEFFT